MKRHSRCFALSSLLPSPFVAQPNPTQLLRSSSQVVESPFSHPPTPISSPSLSSLHPTMATDSQKSTSQNPETENPKETLTLAPATLTEDPRNPSSTTTAMAELQSDSATGEGTGKKEEANDLSFKESGDDTTAVVSPTGDSGSPNDIQKKVRRAERFGVPVQLSENEKRNSRAERFGTGTGSEASKTSEELKRKARAERFGLSVPVEDDSKKKARLAKFGSGAKIDTVEEEKRKARAIRFSDPPSKNVPHINSEGDVGQKTAVAGNTNGGA